MSDNPGGTIEFEDDDNIDPDLDLDNVGDMQGSFEDLPPGATDFDVFDFDNIVEAPDESPIVITKEDLDTLEKNLERLVDKELKKIQAEAKKEASAEKKLTAKENRREIQDDKRAVRREKKTLTNRATRRRTDIRSDAASTKASIYSLSAAMGLPGYVIANVVDRLYISPNADKDIDAEQSYTDELNQFFNDKEDELIQKQRDMEDEKDSIVPAEINRDEVKDFVTSQGERPSTTPQFTPIAEQKKTTTRTNVSSPNTTNNIPPAQPPVTVPDVSKTELPEPISSNVTTPEVQPDVVTNSVPDATITEPAPKTNKQQRKELNDEIARADALGNQYKRDGNEEGYSQYKAYANEKAKELAEFEKSITNKVINQSNKLPDPIASTTSTNEIPDPVTNPIGTATNTVETVNQPTPSSFSGNSGSGGQVPPTSTTPPSPSGGVPPAIPTRGFNPSSITAAAIPIVVAVEAGKFATDVINTTGQSAKESVTDVFSESAISYGAKSAERASKAIDPLGINPLAAIFNQSVQLFASSVNTFGKYTDTNKAFSPETLTVSIEGSINKLTKSMEIAERTDSNKAALKDQLQKIDLIWEDFKANFFNDFAPAIIAILKIISATLTTLLTVLTIIRDALISVFSNYIPGFSIFAKAVIALLGKNKNPINSAVAKELDAFHNVKNQPIAPKNVLNRR